MTAGRASPLSLLYAGDGTIAVQLDERVVLLDVESQRLIWEHPLQTRSLLIPGLVAHPTEPLIAAGTMMEIHWIDLASGRLVQCVKGTLMRTMAVSPDGAFLVAAGLLRQPPQCWRPAVSGQAEEIPVGRNLWEAAAFSPDSRHLFLASTRELYRLRAGTWEVERVDPISDWWIHLKHAAGGERLIAGGTGVAALAAEDGRELWRCSAAGPRFDLTPDGSKVISIQQEEWVELDVITGEERRWPARHRCDRAWSVSVSPHGDAASFCVETGCLELTRIPGAEYAVPSGHL